MLTLTEQELIDMGIHGVSSVNELKSNISDNQASIEFARKRFGGLGASEIYRLTTYRPDKSKIIDLELAIAELQNKIANSTSGRTKTAETDLEKKQEQLESILNDKLPTGALELAEKIAVERFRGFCEESDVQLFDSQATAWGKKYESAAIAELQARYPEYDFINTGNEQKSFQLFDYPHQWATPDTRVVNKAAGEVFAVVDAKCPFNTVEHLRNKRLISDWHSFMDLRSQYAWQGTSQMLCTGLKKFWFVSYDPRLSDKKPLDLIVHKFEFNQDDADFLLSRVAMFEKEVERILSELK